MFGASANVSRRMSRRTSGSITGSWQQNELAGGDRDDRRWDIGLSFSRQMARDVSVSADYRHIEQTSDLPADEFKENRFSMRVNFLF